MFLHNMKLIFIQRYYSTWCHMDQKHKYGIHTQEGYNSLT